MVQDVAAQPQDVLTKQEREYVDALAQKVKERCRITHNDGSTGDAFYWIANAERETTGGRKTTERDRRWATIDFTSIDGGQAYKR